MRVPLKCRVYLLVIATVTSVGLVLADFWEFWHGQ